MRRVLSHRLPGQSMAIAVLAMVAMFMTIGFGIDGGLLYAQRRLMQNTADAACLAAANELARAGTPATARTSAETVIQQNLGATPGGGANAPGTLSYTAIADVYSNGGALEGSGTSLVRGIEITGAQVRVALSSPAFTYFVRLLGTTHYTVAARARCDATAGGGGTPFAVARWRGYNNAAATTPSTGLSTDVTLPGQANVVRDVLAQRSSPLSIITQWPDWGSTTNYPGLPGSGRGVYTQPSPAATDTSPGFPVPIAGLDANANVGGAGFRGPVLLDLRNITNNGGQTYNGLDPSVGASSNKDFITRNIVQGYDGPFVPPGTQLGFVSGVSAGQVARPFDTRYNVGDIVSVLVYNGTVYGESDFTSSFVSNDDAETRGVPSFAGAFPPNCNIDGKIGGVTSGSSYVTNYPLTGSVDDNDNSATGFTPLTFSYRVQTTDSGVNTQPAYFSQFRTRAFSSVSGSQRNGLQVNWGTGGWQSLGTEGTSSAVGSTSIGNSGYTYAVQVQQSATGTCTVPDLVGTPDPITGVITYQDKTYTLPAKPVSGVTTLYLESEDIRTGQRRARYAFINQSAASDDFYAYMPGLIAYEAVRPGNNTQTIKQQVIIRQVNNTVLRANQVSTSFQWFDANLNTISAPSGITPALVRQGGSDELQISVASTVATDVSYYLRTAITANGKTHWIWYYLQIQNPINNSIDSYVYTTGYANFRITSIDSNSIWGEAVSCLIEPNSACAGSGQVIAGMQARLLPWE